MSNTKPGVLIVDDVEGNLVALDALLSDMNCDVVRAAGGNEALKQLLRRDFAVMLLDVQMPEVDGYEVAKYARAHPQTRDVPIIFLTAMHHSEDSMLRAYGSGAVDYLSKPINAEVLRYKVGVFLELYLSRRRLLEEISAHETTLAALELANEALRHFTNAASHDLRAPLRGMRGFLDALAEHAKGQLDPTSLDYLGRCQRAGQRMDSLLNSLLNYARLRKPSAFEDVSFNALLDQVKTDLEAPLAASASELNVGQLPTIKGDADRLYQVCLNLVSNALKFRRSGQAAHIKVSAEPSGSQWLLSVADDGIGIEPKYHSEIFSAFRRLHVASAYEGTGLGLAICKQVIEQHGGRIWVESTPNAGSVFRFSVPAALQALSA